MSALPQISLDLDVGGPPGFRYFPAFLSEKEESRLLHFVRELADLHPYLVRGNPSKRQVKVFGIGRRGYFAGDAQPVPDELLWLRDRCAEPMKCEPEQIGHALVSFYPVGAPIGWHSDAAQYGGAVFGVSLASDCSMDFRPIAYGTGEKQRIYLARRSGYLMSGISRWQWEHHITPVKEERWSITFRTVPKDVLA